MIRLTVFTPAYNRAHTLPRTYESLCSQNCKDFCWLIIDDGSIDNKAQLLKGCMEKDNVFKIQYIYKENCGMHTAHNIAYENITTELNVCVDSDDCMAEDGVAKILKKWDEVKDRLKKSALGMSGGQQQRLCIARALAVQPEVLLMDEPTSALDPISTSKIEELAMELKKDYTIVMVTHNMQQATRISDKTAFFLLGEVVEFDDTDKLFSMPSDKRTEDYITGRFG